MRATNRTSVIYYPVGCPWDLRRGTVPASVHVHARCLIGATGASCVQGLINVTVALQSGEGVAIMRT
jgi:hypothetical protein